VKTSKLIGLFVALSVSAGAAAAQTTTTPNKAGETITIRSEVKDGVTAARAQGESAAATRQQIQAIRAALRARLTALHH
jgi:hypothetical protein